MRRRLAGVVLLVLAARLAPAQRLTGEPAVDSAAVARAADGRAATARRAGDLERARDEAARAAAAWPTQPAYALGWAAAAARAADTAAVQRALAQYASLGLGRDVRGDSLFAPYLRAPGVESLRRALEHNRRRRASSRVRATLADSTFWPEGLDYDPRTGRFYVTSVRRGTVVELGPRGESRELWRPGEALRGAALAARLDASHQALWVTLSGMPQMEGHLPGDSAIGALVRVRLADGAVLRRWDLPVVQGGHALGDVVVTPRGDVFITDSNDPVLYRLRAGADSLEPIRHPLFRSLQGVAATPDGRALYVADYSHGLLRVDLATHAVARLEDAPHSTSLGCDGIAWVDGTLIAIQNGVVPARVMRFVLDASGRRITRAEVLDQNSALADEPTSIVVVGHDAVYVANSQWEKHDATGHRVPGTVLHSPILLALPLPALNPLPAVLPSRGARSRGRG